MKNKLYVVAPLAIGAILIGGLYFLKQQGILALESRKSSAHGDALCKTLRDRLAEAIRTDNAEAIRVYKKAAQDAYCIAKSIRASTNGVDGDVGISVQAGNEE